MIITGGNTFRLLKNLRQSGLDIPIQEFAKRENSILSGFSAGAIVLTPTIGVAGIPGYNENLDNLNDLTGLNIVDFEVFPHFSKDQQGALDSYQKSTKNDIRTITDNEYIVV